MDWKHLTSIDQLDSIIKASNNKPQLLFKHSTRCSVSTFAKKILSSEYNDEVGNKVDCYYLDLISYREVSNAIADKLGVQHESPQIVLVQNGKAIFDASHSSISLDAAVSKL
jgi:bacillithiol system protein YtxJ